MEEVKEKCGLAAISLRGKLDKHPSGGAAQHLVRMLLQQQHRGQAGAGITTYNPDRDILLRTKKGYGLVSEAFKLSHYAKRKAIMRSIAGTAGIGHLRYTTSGKESLENIHPFERPHGRLWKWFSMGFNGNIANYMDLKKRLENDHYHMSRDVDTEILMHFISKEFLGGRKADLSHAFGNISHKLDGAYNIIFINAEGTVVAARDPLGFRPLSYTKNGIFSAAASETCAFLGKKRSSGKPVPPGKMAVLEDGNVKLRRFAKSKRKAHCMFEYVYFANPVSVIDGRGVYRARWRLGAELAKAETLNVNSKEWIVVAVPDTARPAAQGYAEELDIPVMEGIIRNRYIGRTFIEGMNRTERAYEKYSLIKSVLYGKKVLLVEDSVVRGTTTKVLVDRLKKEGGAKEVHVRVSCPPLKCPCFYGIDMTTMGELVAPNKMNQRELAALDEDIGEKTSSKISKAIHADSIAYQSLEGLVNGLALPGGHRNICMACLNGKYPTYWGKKLFKIARRNLNKKSNGRTYESSTCAKKND